MSLIPKLKARYFPDFEPVYEVYLRCETKMDPFAWPTCLELGEMLHGFGVDLHLLLERMPKAFDISFVGFLRKER